MPSELHCEVRLEIAKHSRYIKFVDSNREDNREQELNKGLHCRDVFSRKRVGCVRDQHTRLSYRAIAHHNTLYVSLRLGHPAGRREEDGGREEDCNNKGSR